ncbi:MAG: transcription termination factor NusA, partial [Candidatus Woesebacteria bacterium]
AWPEEKPDERKDVTPPGFGRIAAQTAKQVIHQKIREAEKDAILDEFTGRVGSLISGMILRFDGPDVRVDIGRSEAIMPASERVPDERLTPNQRLTFLLKEITETPRGKRIILSRSDNEFVKKLFEREVPEMSSGSVEIKAISREPGIRSKIAVSSTQSGIDPVGSCVGQKGVRVQSVTNELGGERVDIIPWSADASDFIKASLSPAEELTVTLNEDEELAVVKAPEDQLSLAIGRDGQNARLASKLTGWKIEIKSLEGDEPKDEGQVQETEEGTEEKPTEKTGAGEKEEKDEQEPEGQMEEAEKKEDATKTSDPKSSSGDGKKQDETGESEGEKEEEVSKDQADEKVAESDS